MSLQPMNKHLGDYQLMTEQQRGAKAGCTGSFD